MSAVDAIPLLAAAGGDYQISRSVRLRSSASAYLSRTPASASNRKTWTWSGWVKRGKLGALQVFFTSTSGVSTVNGEFDIYFAADDTIQIGYGAANWRTSLAVFRDPSAWYHIAVAVDTTQASDANRIKLYVNGVLQSVTTNNAITQNTDTAVNMTYLHEIGNLSSFYFDGYLTEVNFIDGQALTASSFGETDGATSVWRPKKYLGTYGTNGFYLPFTNTSTAGGNGFTYSEDFSNAAWTKYQATVSANATTAPNGTTTADKLIETATTGDHQVTRTFSATDNTAYTWSSYAKAGERSNFRMYLQNKAGSYNYADFDLSGGTVSFTSGVTAAIASVGSGWYRCSVSCNAGTGATASPAAILSYSTGTNGSGTNGLYIWGAQLEGSTSVAGAYYSTTSAGFGTYQIGADQSLATGGYNSWVANNISVTAGVTYDSMTDVPTLYADGGNGRGNYAVLNPLNCFSSAVAPTAANLQYTGNTSAWRSSTSTLSMQSGKWYAEFSCSYIAAGSGMMPGIVPSTTSFLNNTNTASSSGYGYLNDGNTYAFGAATASGTTYATNDVIGVAFDATDGKIWFSKNGVWIASGDPSAGTNARYSGITGEWCFALGSFASSASTAYANFGQRPFAYTPPTGFKALNTQNLPDGTIKKGNQYFDATAYTSTGTTQSVVNAGGLQPDLLWVKSRSNTSGNYVTDSSRGSSLYLVTNNTAADVTDAQWITSLNSNGFSIGTNNLSNGWTNVAWQWKESASAGFDIVTYTGNGANRTIAHGLGVAPKLIICKARSAAGYDWTVYHSGLTSNAYSVYLNLTNAQSNTYNNWNSTTPGSTSFSIGNYAWINGNGTTYVAYLFAEVAGYSAFGKYTGNGSADGAFVYLGFRPRYVLVKCSSLSGSSSNWVVHDTARDASNAMPDILLPNASNAELTDTTSAGYVIDCVANGFKIRNTNANWNSSGATYIYAAFAENPTKYSLAR